MSGYLFGFGIARPERSTIMWQEWEPVTPEDFAFVAQEQEDALAYRAWVKIKNRKIGWHNIGLAALIVVTCFVVCIGLALVSPELSGALGFGVGAIGFMWWELKHQTKMGKGEFGL